MNSWDCKLSKHYLLDRSIHILFFTHLHPFYWVADGNRTFSIKPEIFQNTAIKLHEQMVQTPNLPTPVAPMPILQLISES